MISIAELDEYSGRLGLARGQVEKDYLQYQALQFIGQTTGSDLVFKGGTCLQKVFGLDRFSEGLDFSLNRGIRDGPGLDGMIGHFEALGYPAVERPAAGRGGKGSFRILVEGPLFDGGPLSRCSLTVNISSRGDLAREPLVKRLVPPYDEISPMAVLHMGAGEILAEEVRALVTRDKARDIYDLHFLLQKGVRPGRALVDAKLSFYGARLSKTLLRSRVASKRRIWDAELGPLLRPAPPDFGAVSADVMKGLEALFERAGR
ncbi:MAG: nucleotidyl transferase AbiEii/AbiGii toxin family protein [Euryarchaeota archaeon]|nr:nucleotidyl transferase AbiEii/AbiGii toxin family protein [Euryarchaeota archaeon]